MRILWYYRSFLLLSRYLYTKKFNKGLKTENSAAQMRQNLIILCVCSSNKNVRPSTNFNTSSMPSSKKLESVSVIGFLIFSRTNFSVAILSYSDWFFKNVCISGQHWTIPWTFKNSNLPISTEFMAMKKQIFYWQMSSIRLLLIYYGEFGMRYFFRIIYLLKSL